jgi:beta-mannosidase
MDREPADLLASARWECTATPPGAARGPADLAQVTSAWWPAQMPGTAAGALRAAGLWHEHDIRDFDSEDWWYRCWLTAATEIRHAARRELILRAEGLATVAEVFVGGICVLRTAEMFAARACEVDGATLDWPVEVAIAFRALRPLTEARHPRPRWRAQLIRDQNLRFYRTSLLGRMTGWAERPAPVGPWRRLRLLLPGNVGVAEREVTARPVNAGGTVTVRVQLRATADLTATVTTARLRVGDFEGPADLSAADEGLLTVCGTLALNQVELWWPHTHGRPALYPVAISLDGHQVDLGSVGFRSVSADQSTGGYQISVNGVPVFCRGACWVPPDPVSLTAPIEVLRHRLRQAADAGMNMIRITGATVYESSEFFDLCDELGLLVWQDLMLAGIDPPGSEEFALALEREARSVLGALRGRPSLAVVCGGSETEQQAAMLGLPPDQRRIPLLDQRLAALVAEVLPGTPYLPSSPTGGEPPFRPDTGVSHYFGVGCYLQPPEDARRAGVRFAAECLALSAPPERAAVDEFFGSAAAAGHLPAWKLGVPRDAGRSWDFEDIRDHYVATLFAVDPRALRRTDPELALDLGRAAMATLVESTLAEWRRPGSRCDGALVLALADLWPGAGWGLLDSAGRPKSTYYAFARASAPVAVLLTDEGLNGLAIHCCNDTAEDIEAVLEVALIARGKHPIAVGERAISVPARGGVTAGAEEVLGEFRDACYAYRFGRPAHDAVSVTLRNKAGVTIARGIYLLRGSGWPAERDVGLTALMRPAGRGFEAEISCQSLAAFVTIEANGFLVSDSWFHLTPDRPHRVTLTANGRSDRAPAGRVRALNSAMTASLRLGLAADEGNML